MIFIWQSHTVWCCPPFPISFCLCCHKISKYFFLTIMIQIKETFIHTLFFTKHMNKCAHFLPVHSRSITGRLQWDVRKWGNQSYADTIFIYITKNNRGVWNIYKLHDILWLAFSFSRSKINKICRDRSLACLVHSPCGSTSWFA